MSEMRTLDCRDFPVTAVGTTLYSKENGMIAQCASPGMAREIALRLNYSDQAGFGIMLDD